MPVPPNRAPVIFSLQSTRKSWNRGGQSVRTVMRKVTGSFMRVSTIRLLLRITIDFLHISMSRHATCVISSNSVMTVMGSGWTRNRQKRTELQHFGVLRTGGTILPAIVLTAGLIQHHVSAAMVIRRRLKPVRLVTDKHRRRKR